MSTPTRMIYLALCASFCTTPAFAQDEAPVANLAGKLGYNSDLGAIAGAAFSTDKLLGEGNSLRFGFEVSEQAMRLDLGLRSNTQSANPVFGLDLGASRSNGTDALDFHSETLQITPRLTWRVGGGATLSTYLSWSRAEISQVPATTSWLLRQDEDARERTAGGIDYSWQARYDATSVRVDVGAEYGQTTLDHDYWRLSAGLRAGTRFGANDQLALDTNLRGGTILTQSGASHVGDRYVLGQATLRGFDFGGYGPRDLAVADRPALGGNSYVAMQTDLRFLGAFGADVPITPGVFLDLGSLWRLDSVDGGLTGNDPVDDGFHLRGSVGLSFAIRTGIGPIQINFAHAFAHEDYDRRAVASLTYTSTF